MLDPISTSAFQVLTGKKYIALAISEAFAGSDVNGLQTTAVRDRDSWIVNGTKKHVTIVLAFLSSLTIIIVQVDYKWNICGLLHNRMQDRGMYLIYEWIWKRVITFSQTGFTVILIERGPGVYTTQIKTAYSSVAGTAFVIFDNVRFQNCFRCPVSHLVNQVRVPISNTLGKIGSGMSVILSNFNHERWMVTATSIAAQRLVVEECLKFVTECACMPHFLISFG